MKKIVLLLATLSICLAAGAQEHLKFKNIPLDGPKKAFIQEIQKSDFRLIEEPRSSWHYIWESVPRRYQSGRTEAIRKATFSLRYRNISRFQYHIFTVRRRRKRVLSRRFSMNCIRFMRKRMRKADACIKNILINCLILPGQVR